ncbi:trypsin-like peptidase domain-containing protein [Candidatus Saccharibacteria bacterium]|nr:trypsin-like peptidase domain-containing protein [Candidatus Saccharibacteria bacterium]
MQKTRKTSARKRSVSSSKVHSKTKKAVKARVVRYTPKTKSKALAKKSSNPIMRLIKKPYVSIPIGAALAVGAFFLISNNIVPSLESIQESVVQIEACNKFEYDCGSGSGFAAFRDNYIVTNYHVIEGADTISIKTVAGVEGKATDIVAFDPVNDIAIIEWGRKLNPIRIGSSENAKVGDKVLAIGNPMSETNVVSEGIISSKTSDRGLMTTAAISPGSSGGALILDSDHKVIGVTYLKKTGGESMNYAVKIEDVSKVHDTYKKNAAFSINRNSADDCHTTLSKIALDVANLAFSGCKGSDGDVYTVSSLGIFFDVTNGRSRFEYALNERSDWKAVYDRLGSSAKNALILTMDNSTSALFDTNWKFAIWAGNEVFYYSCQTDECMVYRYIYGFYPTINNNTDVTAADFEKL